MRRNATPNAPGPEWLTIAEAASLLRVHRSTLYRWADRGRLELHRFGQRTVRVRRREIDRLGREEQDAARGDPTSGSADAGSPRAVSGAMRRMLCTRDDVDELMESLAHAELGPGEPPTL